MSCLKLLLIPSSQIIPPGAQGMNLYFARDKNQATSMYHILLTHYLPTYKYWNLIIK